MSASATPQAVTPDALSGDGKSLRLDSAQNYLGKLIKELRAQGVERRGSLVAVLEYLSSHINQTREQIGSLRADGAKTHPLSGTADQLEEVVSETAKAAHTIISAAEEIERLAAKADPETAQAISDQVIRIYEASAFQDISGQRIAKAIGALQFIDERIADLIQACGPLPIAAATPAPTGDESLLNGPQLKGKASRQADIDKLFD